MDSTMLATLITAFVTIAGWILSNYLIRKREDRTKRLQIKLDYTRSQIEELYGPLYSQINQLFKYWEVQERIIEPQDDSTKNQLEIYFREKYFTKIHLEMKELLMVKFHLIEEVEYPPGVFQDIPKSFWDYLQLSTQVSAQVDIWNELHISTSYVNGLPWPEKFTEDVKSQLDSLKRRYNNLIKELK